MRFLTTHKDCQGSVHYMDFSLTPVLDDGGCVIHLIPEGQDITDQIVAEQARRESDTLYATLVENAGDAILVMEEGRFIRFNQKALSLFDCTYDQLFGQTPSHFSPPTQPDGRDSKEASLDKIEQALTGASQLFEWNSRACRRYVIPR